MSRFRFANTIFFFFCFFWLRDNWIHYPWQLNFRSAIPGDARFFFCCSSWKWAGPCLSTTDSLFSTASHLFANLHKLGFSTGWSTSTMFVSHFILFFFLTAKFFSPLSLQTFSAVAVPLQVAETARQPDVVHLRVDSTAGCVFDHEVAVSRHLSTPFYDGIYTAILTWRSLRGDPYAAVLTWRFSCHGDFPAMAIFLPWRFSSHGDFPPMAISLSWRFPLVSIFLSSPWPLNIWASLSHNGALLWHKFCLFFFVLLGQKKKHWVLLFWENKFTCFLKMFVAVIYIYSFIFLSPLLFSWALRYARLGFDLAALWVPPTVTWSVTSSTMVTASIQGHAF